MLYRVVVVIYGKGYYKALAIGKCSAYHKQAVMLSRLGWYTLQRYDAYIERLF